MKLAAFISAFVVVCFVIGFFAAYVTNDRFGLSTLATNDTQNTERGRLNVLLDWYNNFGTSTANTWAGLQTFSSTGTSTWAGGIQIDGGGFQVSTLTTASCDLKADTSGNFYCGTDATGAGGGSWPFTTTNSYNAQITQSTSTLLWLTGSSISLAASSSVLTYASSTALTSGTLYLTNALSTSYGGTGVTTFGGTNHVLYTSAADTLASEAALTYLASGDLLTLVNASTTNMTISQSLFLESKLQSPYRFVTFTYATTTWTGTTTVLRTAAPFTGVLQDVQCDQEAGTLNVQFYVNSTAVTGMFNASTTAGTVTFSANNTFTRGDTIQMQVGTPASTPQDIRCTARTYKTS